MSSQTHAASLPRIGPYIILYYTILERRERSLRRQHSAEKRTPTGLASLSLDVGDNFGEVNAHANRPERCAQCKVSPAEWRLRQGRLQLREVRGGPPLPFRAHRRRAWYRQPDTCCGYNCHRRATSETRTPGFSVSATIRAFSSADQRRRRPGPVSSSTRRKLPFMSSLISFIRINRSPLFHALQVLSGLARNNGLEKMLTFNHLSPNQKWLWTLCSPPQFTVANIGSRSDEKGYRKVLHTR
jgi:hypothetical protein